MLRDDVFLAIEAENLVNVGHLSNDQAAQACGRGDVEDRHF